MMISFLAEWMNTWTPDEMFVLWWLIFLGAGFVSIRS
jgi:hypothetical protein